MSGRRFFRQCVECVFWLVVAWLCMTFFAIGQEPTWTMWPGDNDHGPLADVTSRFDGRQNDVHENCHLLINHLQWKWDAWGKRIHPMYCLRGRIAAIKEPDVMLGEVADAMPLCLRGRARPTYLVSQRRYFEKNPLYPIEEWVCYSNEFEWRPDSLQLEYPFEFIAYSVQLLSMLPAKCPQYDATQLSRFVQWQAKRTMRQARESKLTPVGEVLVALRSSPDARDLRAFMWRVWDRSAAEAVLVAGDEVLSCREDTAKPSETQFMPQQQSCPGGNCGTGWRVFGRR